MEIKNQRGQLLSTISRISLILKCI